jgi:DNA-binding transcriptional LysR family regulator
METATFRSVELFNRNIELFKALYEIRKMTTAAERLGLQQPAVSKALAKLESEMGRELFLRTRAGLLPTTFADQLATQILEAHDDWQLRFDKLIGAENEVAGSFRIGSHAVLASIYLMSRVAKLSRTHAQLHLDIQFKRSAEIAKEVVEGRCHFGVVAGPAPNPELVIRTLGSEFAAVWGKTPLKKNSIVYYNPEMIQVQHYTRSLKTFRLVAITDYEVIYNAILNGHGEGGILPSEVAKRSPKLQAVSKPFYTTKIQFIYRYDLPKTAATRAIIDSFKNDER